MRGCINSCTFSIPVSLQVNLALGSHILLVPSQSFSSLPSSQSLSPSHLQRSGMQVPSVTQWNSSPLHSITDGSTETKIIRQLLHPRSTTHTHGQRHQSIELLCFKISFIVYKYLYLQARHLAVIIGRLVPKMENISLKAFQVYVSKKLLPTLMALFTISFSSSLQIRVN